jgi:hypothetical protein
MTERAPLLENFFLVDANLVGALPALMGRGRPLSVADGITLLALFAYVQRQPLDRARCDDDGGTKCVTFIARRAALLDELQRRRTRVVGTGRTRDFRPDEWRRLAKCLENLDQRDVEFAYSVLDRRHRAQFRTFSEPLIICDSGTPSERDLSITLKLCDGILSRFYVSVPRSIFGMRGVSESGMRLFLWILRKHRGRRGAGRMAHNTRLILDARELVRERVLVGAHSKKLAFRALTKALAQLVHAKVAIARRGLGTGYEVDLSTGFFVGGNAVARPEDSENPRLKVRFSYGVDKDNPRKPRGIQDSRLLSRRRNPPAVGGAGGDERPLSLAPLAKRALPALPETEPSPQTRRVAGGDRRGRSTFERAVASEIGGAVRERLERLTGGGGTVNRSTTPRPSMRNMPGVREVHNNASRMNRPLTNASRPSSRRKSS